MHAKLQFFCLVAFIFIHVCEKSEAQQDYEVYSTDYDTDYYDGAFYDGDELGEDYLLSSRNKRKKKRKNNKTNQPGTDEISVVRLQGFGDSFFDSAFLTFLDSQKYEILHSDPLKGTLSLRLTRAQNLEIQQYMIDNAVTKYSLTQFIRNDNNKITNDKKKKNQKNKNKKANKDKSNSKRPEFESREFTEQNVEELFELFMNSETGINPQHHNLQEAIKEQTKRKKNERKRNKKRKGSGNRAEVTANIYFSTREQLQRQNFSSENYDFKRFLTLEEIEDYLRYISAEYSQFVTLETLGITENWNRIGMISITNKSSTLSSQFQKPIIFIEAGMSGADWASVGSALYLIKQLAANPQMLEDVEWKIIPVLNPDGYKYSQEIDRFWVKNAHTTSLSCVEERDTANGSGGNKRKNRGKQGKGKNKKNRYNYQFPGLANLWSSNSQPEQNNRNQGIAVRQCVGINIGTNFEIRDTPVSDKCGCSERSEIPFTEKEVVALRDELMGSKERILAYVSIHGYGSSIVHSPYTTFEKEAQLNIISERMADAIKEQTGTVFLYGQPKMHYYPSLMSTNWVFSQLQVPFVLNFRTKLADNLRPYLLPEKELKKTASEFYVAIGAMYKFMFDKDEEVTTRLPQRQAADPTENSDFGLAILTEESSRTTTQSGTTISIQETSEDPYKESLAISPTNVKIVLKDESPENYKVKKPSPINIQLNEEIRMRLKELKMKILSEGIEAALNPANKQVNVHPTPSVNFQETVTLLTAPNGQPVTKIYLDRERDLAFDTTYGPVGLMGSNLYNLFKGSSEKQPSDSK